MRFILLILSITLITCSASDTENLGPKMNRLKDETSPYLLQHAANPVDWYPWGEEAFEKAKSENKPIFLSIGYSSCHWCHVMEEESFEDDSVAKILNEKFVSVKVDREERPDVDNIYMTACQMMSGNCGWPLNLFLNLDLKPFFAGTYFPKESKFGRIGFIDLLERVDEQWNNQRDKIDEMSNSIGNAISSDFTSKETSFNKTLIDSTFEEFAQTYDSDYGGFGLRPKFPSPHNLSFLMNYYYTYNDSTALKMVVKTLTEMRKGGIFDQVGFGFHRYSTDNIWLLPHFEKMLYDQATLLRAYTEAYKLTGNPLFKQTAYEIVMYVQRDMTGENGEFFSAEDADAEGIEGKFYVWEKSDIERVLGSDAEEYIDVFNIYDKGNYKEEAAGHGAGGNIPHISEELDELAKRIGLNKERLFEKFEKMRVKLYEDREKRVHPFKDKKALTDWNAHFTASLAFAGRTFDDNDFRTLAENNIKFIEKYMIDGDNLSHSYLNGTANITAHLDDYAYLSKAYIELYFATLNPDYLLSAKKYTDLAIGKFHDSEKGGFYFSVAGKSDLIARTKELYDNAIPSGNSIMFENLIRISKLTGETEYYDMASKMIDSFSGLIEKAPSAFASIMNTAITAYNESFEVVIIGDNSKSTKRFMDELNKNYVPNMVFIYKEIGQEKSKIDEFAEYASYMYDLEGETTAYVCKNFACENPTNDINLMLEYLKIKKK